MIDQPAPLPGPPATAVPPNRHNERLQAVLARLAATPWRFDFFHALRLIDAQQAGRPRLGTARRPIDEPVRLGQSPDLSFAPSALHAVVWPAGATRPRVDVRFMGLFGPNGALPLHLTDHARERQQHHGDETLARFVDLFHHRMLLLFYRAWAQAQPTVSLDRPADDRFADYVGSLIGIGTPLSRGHDAAKPHVKLHFAGLLARQVRSAEGLQALLSGWLKRSVQVEQFAGAWLALRPAERTRIGRGRTTRRNTSAQLGRGAVLGATVWDRQHHFSLAIGPLDHDGFTALLPGGQTLPALVALVDQYVGHEFGWNLQLGLRAAQIQPVRPGRHGRLGWDSWLGSPRQQQPGQPDATLCLAPVDALRSLQRRQSSAAQAPVTPH